MGLFSKSVPDQDWLQEVIPLYDAARPLGVALSQAIGDMNVELQLGAAQRLILEFPSIREGVSRSATPTSREARRAKKSLDLALKDYIEGAQLDLKFYGDLADGLGERLSETGITGRAAAGRTAFQKSFFEDIVKKAEKRMNDAAGFFSLARRILSVDTRPAHNRGGGFPMASFLQRIFGGGISPEQRDAVLAYMAEEWKLQAVQDAEGSHYNMVLTKYGGGPTPGSEGMSEVVSAAQHQAQAYTELSRRHGELSPVPDEAGACYFKWEETYMRLQEWATAMVAVFEGFEAGATPNVQRATELQAAEQKAEKNARKEELKLLRGLSVSPEQYRRLFQEAGAADGALPQAHTATSTTEPATRFCTNCGKQAESEQSFCAGCGMALQG